MKISARMDYAIRALLELGLHWPNSTPRQLLDLSKKAGVSQKFLIHILISLKGLGYVHSVRGKSGGYALSIAPSEIKLADVVKEFGGLGTYDEDQRKNAKDDPISFLWRDIDKIIVEALKKVTLEDLCNRQRQQVKAISYDI